MAGEVDRRGSAKRPPFRWPWSGRSTARLGELPLDEMRVLRRKCLPLESAIASFGLAFAAIGAILTLPFLWFFFGLLFLAALGPTGKALTVGFAFMLSPGPFWLLMGIGFARLDQRARNVGLVAFPVILALSVHWLLNLDEPTEGLMGLAKIAWLTLTTPLALLGLPPLVAPRSATIFNEEYFEVVSRTPELARRAAWFRLAASLALLVAIAAAIGVLIWIGTHPEF